jgi:hypothetical protein
VATRDQEKDNPFAFRPNRPAAGDIRAIVFETGTMSPGDSLADQSKNLEPQMNADKRK